MSLDFDNGNKYELNKIIVLGITNDKQRGLQPQTSISGSWPSHPHINRFKWRHVYLPLNPSGFQASVKTSQLTLLLRCQRWSILVVEGLLLLGQHKVILHFIHQTKVLVTDCALKPMCASLRCWYLYRATARVKYRL